MCTIAYYCCWGEIPIAVLLCPSVSMESSFTNIRTVPKGLFVKSVAIFVQGSPFLYIVPNGLNSFKLGNLGMKQKC